MSGGASERASVCVFAPAERARLMPLAISYREAGSLVHCATKHEHV